MQLEEDYAPDGYVRLFDQGLFSENRMLREDARRLVAYRVICHMFYLSLFFQLTNRETYYQDCRAQVMKQQQQRNRRQIKRRKAAAMGYIDVMSDSEEEDEDEDEDDEMEEQQDRRQEQQQQQLQGAAKEQKKAEEERVLQVCVPAKQNVKQQSKPTEISPQDTTKRGVDRIEVEEEEEIVVLAEKDNVQGDVVIVVPIFSSSTSSRGGLELQTILIKSAPSQLPSSAIPTSTKTTTTTTATTNTIPAPYIQKVSTQKPAAKRAARKRATAAAPKKMVCGHNYCEMMWTENCCACSDKRPIVAPEALDTNQSNQKKKSRKKKKQQVVLPRYQHYCPSCYHCEKRKEETTEKENRAMAPHNAMYTPGPLLDMDLLKRIMAERVARENISASASHLLQKTT